MTAEACHCEELHGDEAISIARSLDWTSLMTPVFTRRYIADIRDLHYLAIIAWIRQWTEWREFYEREQR